MLSRPLVRRLLVLGGLVCLFGSRVAHADTLRIGYFDVKRILAEVDDAKEAKSRLEAEYKEKQKQLDDQKSEIDRLQRDYEAKQAVMSDSAQKQAQAELIQKAQSAQKLYMDLQGELANQEQKALGDLITRLEPVVREVAEADGYTYVFEKNEAGLFYAPTAHDLTAELIRRYNVRYPGHGEGGKRSSAKGGRHK